MPALAAPFLRSSPEVSFAPYWHFTLSQAFGETLSADVLDWLARDAPWKLARTDFYEQFEFSLLHAATPHHLSFIRTWPFLDAVRKWTERVFKTTLQRKVDCTAHKLVKGQRIRIHNDFRVDGESHRILIHLNRGWQPSDGGYLMLFNSDDVSDVAAILPPLHDTVTGFAVSSASHHAVSMVHSGERYTLVLSFYADKW